MNINRSDQDPTFEEVCRKAEFSELIHLVLTLTDKLLHLCAWLKLHFEGGRTLAMPRRRNRSSPVL